MTAIVGTFNQGKAQIVRLKMSDFIHFFEEKKKYDHLFSHLRSKDMYEEKISKYDPLAKIKDKYPTTFFFDEEKEATFQRKKLKQVEDKVINFDCRSRNRSRTQLSTSIQTLLQSSTKT